MKTKRKKISIIVSAYNTEKYIEKCIDSILKQTYSNLELIIIEDASSDKTLEKIEKYQEYENVTIIKNENNKGLSYSRNIGLKNSTGEYIGYIDADDYIDPDYYDNLMTAIEKENSEIAICDMKLYFEKTNQFQIINGCDGALNKLNCINNGLAASACNKLFKKEIISQYTFSENKINEDIAVVVPALIVAKKISYVPGTFYYYVQRENSIQNSKFSEKRFDLFYGVDLTLKRIKDCEDYELIKDALIFNQIIAIFLFIFPKIDDFHERKIILKKYAQYIKKYDILQNKFLIDFFQGSSLKNRIYFKTLFNLECNGHYNFANFIFSSFIFYKKRLRKSLIKKIEKKDLLKAAQANQKEKDYNIKITVVIPNYNYEKFLYQRLYSVLYQKVKIHEIIILDDCSKDNSRKMIDDLVEILKPYIKVKKNYNKSNSGSAFKQWQKGFSFAEGDYVWVAEADDYCSNKLLKKLVQPILKEENIIISYSNTAFINTTGNIILPSIKNEIDIMKTGHWDKSYINNGKNEFQNYSFLNCTIANVSSALIKKGEYSSYFEISKNYKQAGDWLFYVNIMQLGKIAYYEKPLNYYRVHGNNVSSITKKQSHMEEIIRIHEFFEKTYGLNASQKKEIKKRYNFLKKAWNLEEVKYEK